MKRKLYFNLRMRKKNGEKSLGQRHELATQWRLMNFYVLLMRIISITFIFGKNRSAGSTTKKICDSFIRLASLAFIFFYFFFHSISFCLFGFRLSGRFIVFTNVNKNDTKRTQQRKKREKKIEGRKNWISLFPLCHHWVCGTWVEQ